MGKFSKISMTALLITALFLVNVCLAAAAGISALTFASEDAPPVMQSGDTATPSDAGKEELPDSVPDGQDGAAAEPEDDPVLPEGQPAEPEDEPEVTDENIPPNESVTGGEPATSSDATEDDTLQSNDDMELPEEPELQAEAGTLDELMEQLEALSLTGGTLRLTADIEVPPDTMEMYSGDRDGPMINLDVGEYTIYVYGTLKLLPYLTISGKGGENGLLQVMDGGELHLYGIALDALEGYAVYQQDGGLLYHGSDGFHWGVDFSCEGEIRYGIPLAMPNSALNPKNSLPVVVVQSGQNPLDLLPETDSASLSQNGDETYGVDLPVVWNADSAAGNFERRERVLLVGEYGNGIRAMSPPRCLVVFQDERPATLLQCWGKPGHAELEQPPLAELYFKLADPESSYRLDWSPDGVDWQAAPDSFIDMPDEDRIWYRGRIDGTELPFFVCVAVIGPDGSETYSDVVRVTGEDYPGDPGGNRGGGTDLEPPELPPPDNGTDDGIDTSPGKPKPPDHGTDSGSGGGTDTSPGKPKPPDHGTDSGNGGGTDTSPGKPKPPDHGTDSGNGGGTDTSPGKPKPPGNGGDGGNSGAGVSPGQPQPPGGDSVQEPVWPAPPISNTVKESTTPEVSDAGTGHQSQLVSRVPSGKQIISMEPEKTEASDAAPPPVQDETQYKAQGEVEPAVPAAASPDSQSEGTVRPTQAAPASRARVLAQMIAGIAVTGGIVALTVTFSPKAGWGKRVLRMLSALLKR